MERLFALLSVVPALSHCFGGALSSLASLARIATVAAIALGAWQACAASFGARTAKYSAVARRSDLSGGKQ